MEFFFSKVAGYRPTTCNSTKKDSIVGNLYGVIDSVQKQSLEKKVFLRISQNSYEFHRRAPVPESLF